MSQGIEDPSIFTNQEFLNFEKMRILLENTGRDTILRIWLTPSKEEEVPPISTLHRLALP